MHHLKVNTTTWVNHNSDWSGDVQVCWDGKEAWIPGSVIVAAGKAQVDAEMLSLLRDALSAIEELGGRVGELPRELPTAIEIQALLKRLGE